MSVTILSSAMAQMADRGRISPNDVIELRHSVFARGVGSAEEAAVLIKLNNSCAPDIEAWNHFFVDTLTDYVVYQTEPRGYVTARNTDWLMDHITTEGIVETTTSMELLISILERARWAPTRLAAFSLEQARRGILEGRGPISRHPYFEQGVIGKKEVQLLKRILFAYSGEQNIGISRGEAEVLLELNAATADRQNHPDWPELFLKAMSNHMLVASGYKAPPRDDALRSEAWMGADGSIQGLLTKMVTGSVKEFFEAYIYSTDDEKAFAQLEIERIEMLLGEKVPQEEASWLTQYIGRNGALNENETALLALIKTEAPDLHPSLKPLLEMVA